MLFQEDSNNWNPYSKGASARIGYNTRTARYNLFPSDNPPTLYDSYRPNDVIGSTGLQGQYIYQLDANPTSYVNPRSFCLNWYYQQSSVPFWASYYGTQPCPCSIWQAFFDPRFTRCNTASFIPNTYSGSYLYSPPNCKLDLLF